MLIFQSHLDLDYVAIMMNVLFISALVAFLVLRVKKEYKKLFFIFSLLTVGIFFTMIRDLFYIYEESKQIEQVLKDQTYLIAEGNITHLYLPKKSTRNRAHFIVNDINFTISYRGDFPEKHGLFYAFDNAINQNNQHVKIFYIQKDDSFNLCLPFLTHCIEFNKPIKNKIIKLWVKKL